MCFLSVEPIADQPRIRRQGDALHAAGYQVVGIGRDGARTPAPAWPVRELELPRLQGFARQRAALAQFLSPLGRRASEFGYWADRRRRAVLDAALAEAPDIVVAREWRTLPIAARVARRHGSRIVMDSPELSSEELMESRVWRTFFRPMVVAIERSLLPVTDLVTAVNESIADAIQQRYRLARRPLVLRNVPPYEQAAPRPPDGITRALYLGGVVQGRGLEPLIESVAAWPADWTLTIMGPSEPDYRAHLEMLAAPVVDRVTFADPVPLTSMVGEAARFDVGVFAHQPNGRQADLALPNKLFEYFMAGLAVCVSDMTAMGAVVRETRTGVLIPAPYGAGEIAGAVARLQAEGTLGFRMAARSAARRFNWEHEQVAYVQAIDELIATHPTVPGSNRFDR